MSWNNKMEFDSECPVCGKPLKKGKKYYGVFCQGDKYVFACSSKCFKKFDMLNDDIDDIDRSGSAFISEIIQQFEELYHEKVLKDYSFRYITKEKGVNTFHDKYFYKFVMKHLQAGLLHIEIATKVFEEIRKLEGKGE